MIIYIDCFNVLDALKSYPECSLDLSAIARDILSLVSYLMYCRIEKCNKDRLSEAHNLAIQARK